MKCFGILLLQLLITVIGFWYVFDNPQKPAQIAEALRYASIGRVLLGWACYSVVEVLTTVRWRILLATPFARLRSFLRRRRTRPCRASGRCPLCV
jgi:hypothetical protein